MRVIQITQHNLLLFGGEESAREIILAHLLRLEPEARYLRFFASLSDDGIKKYVDKIDFSTDGVFVTFDADGVKIIGMLHAGGVTDGECEMGLTVEQYLRGQGIGYELFKTAVTWAKSLGCKRIYVNCLAENKSMQRIAEKFNMETKSIDFDTKEAEIKIPNGYVDFMSYITHHANNNLLLCDLAYRRNLHALFNYVNHDASN